MTIRDQIYVQVAGYVKGWADFMDKERLKYATFSLGPHPQDDVRGVEVGLVREILEDKGYKVTSIPSVVSVQEVPTKAGSPAAIPIVFTLFQIESPKIKLV
jgi:hypothetical protein